MHDRTPRFLAACCLALLSAAAAVLVKLTHALTPRISVVTRSGEDNAIDVFYHFTFD